MGIFSRKGNNGGHKADQTVEGFVRFYLGQGSINSEQFGALDAMARSSEDQRRVQILRDAIAEGTVEFQFEGGGRRFS